MTVEASPLTGLEFSTLLLEEGQHVLTITLNRPHRRNAMNDTMVGELIYALDYARWCTDVRVVILAARGDVFCAGGDLKAMGGAVDKEQSNVPIRGGSDDMALRLYRLDKPVIARIQGPALAGALLMICNATHAVAAEHAHFAAPEIHRGLWPFQVMAGLFRVMPWRQAMDFIIRGYRMSASEAARLGLINDAVPASELDLRVQSLAADLAALAPETMQIGLAARRAQSTMTFEEAVPYLRGEFARCLNTENAREGIAAFLEKRPPRWR